MRCCLSSAGCTNGIACSRSSSISCSQRKANAFGSLQSTARKRALSSKGEGGRRSSVAPVRSVAWMLRRSRAALRSRVIVRLHVAPLQQDACAGSAACPPVACSPAARVQYSDSPLYIGRFSTRAVPRTTGTPSGTRGNVLYLSPGDLFFGGVLPQRVSLGVSPGVETVQARRLTRENTQSYSISTIRALQPLAECTTSS